MSTSQPGSDAGAQKTASLPIGELKRQLYLADLRIKRLENENQQLEQDHKKTKRENKQLAIERDSASYDIQQALKTEALEKELAILRDQIAAEKSMKPKEDSTSKDSKAPKGSIRTYEELKQSFKKLSNIATRMDRALIKLRDENPELKGQLKAYQDAFHAIKAVIEGGDSGFEGVDPLMERVAAAEDDYEISLNTDCESLDSTISLLQKHLASLKETKDVGLNALRQARYEAHRSLSQRDSRLIEVIRRVSPLFKERSETAFTPKGSAEKTAQDDRVAAKETKRPKTSTASKEIEGLQPSKHSKQEERLTTPTISTGGQTEGKQPEDSNSVEKRACEELDVQDSERILELEDEMEKAELRYQDLGKRYGELEQRYQELQRINVSVVDENAALTKKIENTLEAFIPKAEKMLHQGTKINKSSQNLLNALVKIVRDGLRDG